MTERVRIYAIGEESLQNVVTVMGSHSGGGGSGVGGLEARVAKIEAAVEHVQTDIREIKGDIRDHRDTAQTDFRILFGAIITVALGLAALMAHGFKWL